MGVIIKPILFQAIKPYQVYWPTTYSFNTFSQIFILNSHDIYRNLTFEECLYREGEKYFQSLKEKPSWFTKILLWRNTSSIVIGRFQNPWKEVNLSLIHFNKWKLARRSTGGGTVYHDLGNLNISFIQPRYYMNRQQCMEFLQSVLEPLLIPLNYTIHIGNRYDLWIKENQMNINTEQNMMKISGSSSKFGSNMAYHHCTLLFDANLNNLSEVLKPTFNDSITSNPMVTKIFEGQEDQFIHSIKDFQQGLALSQTWSWIYGHSPSFQLTLENYEPNLSNLTNQFGSIVIDFSRGGIFQSIYFDHSQNGNVDPSLNDFLSEITLHLHGAECRTHSWDFILDQFVFKKFIQLNGENMSDEQCRSSSRVKRPSKDDKYQTKKKEMWNIKGVWNVYHPLLETIYGSIILNKDIENLHDNTGYNYNWK
ncbi:lipoate-protein ligase, putative [Schistosoma mansoni]|uniref:lipoate-protein ligase, putative n=1 Tax=Schistosoma mansoni TaxID=6183 RepID=UPI0001A6264D|nr:lipoate-protein ligase, putative [Schistosoma mansoni]|eukprot:XP_018646083.1 lipoate-protein ligase, putative [Schistosoma mansoni]